ncbi:hypothetical protein CHS0354_024720 [Potamilus streckersoni]|uniref:Uncharacterized protein n=1 Tax=Potamilus streckersoni TaxID=2493646 RepID=A0AAE0RX25_9BIVA|nr:hypothetical protein CHS0354_024720 [Potamilus streckersoni]
MFVLKGLTTSYKEFAVKVFREASSETSSGRELDAGNGHATSSSTASSGTATKSTMCHRWQVSTLPPVTQADSWEWEIASHTLTD